MQFKIGQLVRRVSANDWHVLGVRSVCRITQVLEYALILKVVEPFPGKFSNEKWPIGHTVIYDKCDFIHKTKRLKRKQNAL